MRGMLEPAVAPAMACDIGLGRVADRLGGRVPEFTGIVIAEIEYLARPIADRVVRPWCDLVLPTIGGRGIAAALGRELKAE